ncbi:MAG TPA: Spy/CpxP family protein refolding chaperone [Steroidobacteraceae bacterium]|nr:Spy/CpxP family protein refolding chaperone [Steroidobacteraceae bacterium]
MNPRLKLVRNAVLGALLSGGVLVTYETSALSQDEPATTTPQDQPHRHWGDHGGNFGHRPDAFGIGMDGGFGPALKQLDLTDEQKKSVHGIFEDARPRMQKLHESLRSMVDTFQGTMPDDPQYAAAVARATKDSQALAASMVQEASSLRTQVYSVLTPEQKARLPDLMKQAAAERKSQHHGPQPDADGASN